ncbi:DUF1566 domain-containing protein [Dokdonella sp.]|uniref:Lcl domain-containing protein n=1 Tax=Dokdonella sp. TaxID=2291710 RepID=UPI0026256B7D|nr:DUF1566 domain-containing protein [Dokdonella sp.]
MRFRPVHLPSAGPADARRNLSSALVAVLLLGASPTLAQIAPPQARNDTGQTLCFEPDGTPTDCANPNVPGQDGAIGRDRAALDGALPRTGSGLGSFDLTKIANDGGELPASAVLGSAPAEWACSRDNHTGLLWEVKTNDFGPRHNEWAFSWHQPDPDNDGGDPGPAFDTQLMCMFTLDCNSAAYLAHVNAIRLCGRDDWRLPTVDELHGLVHYGSGDPLRAMETTFFPAAGNPVFWTADTAMEPGPESAYSINMLDGHTEAAPKGGGHVTVLAVSGAPPAPATDAPTCSGPENPLIRSSTGGAFVLHADGTTTDTRTGLMWSRCAYGQKGRGETDDYHCEGDPEPMPWEEALRRVRDLNAEGHLGYGDWRLPNIKELQSLLERRCKMPSLDSRVFPDVNPEPVWSSTSDTFMDQHQRAWGIQMEMGVMVTLEKGDAMRLRLVRGGATFDDYAGASTFSVGGTVDGLVGTALVLELDAGQVVTATVDADGRFTFPVGLSDGTAWAVRVRQAPVPHQDCSASPVSGTIAGASVTDVAVVCAAPAAAEIAVAPGSLQYALASGQSTQTSVGVANRGGGILHWAINTAHSGTRRDVTAGIPGDAACESGPLLIVHDDGTPETAFGGGLFTNGWTIVDRFTPTSYPASFGSVCLAFAGSGGATTLDFDLVLYADNGPGGSPGAELGSIRAQATGLPQYPVLTPQWQRFDLSSLYSTITSGSVYLGVRGVGTGGAVFLLADTSADRPAGFAGGHLLRASGWMPTHTAGGFEEYRALFVRAEQAPAQPLPTGCDNPNTVPWLTVTPRSGQTLAGQSGTVQIGIDTTGMLPGRYGAVLCFVSDAANGPVQVPVDLTVAGSTHRVSPDAGPHGSISPAAPQTVGHGESVQFTLAPDGGYVVHAVEGSCGGSLNGNVFTTAAVVADCTVDVTFAPDPLDRLFVDGFDPG